jgi:hypothetical protein
VFLAPYLQPYSEVASGYSPGNCASAGQKLETGFRTATMTESDLHVRVTRIAALQGGLRAIHLAAHVTTRAILSESQIVRYNELRGYTESAVKHQDGQHKH